MTITQFAIVRKHFRLDQNKLKKAQAIARICHPRSVRHPRKQSAS